MKFTETFVQESPQKWTSENFISMKMDKNHQFKIVFRDFFLLAMRAFFLARAGQISIGEKIVAYRASCEAGFSIPGHHLGRCCCGTQQVVGESNVFTW